MRPKKILIILNYYYPYISGVSEYARILAQELSAKGNEVTVLTSNHAKLPEQEMIQGVKVIRAPIIMKISKGTVSPVFLYKAIHLAKEADVVNLHLPMIESGLISSFMKGSKIITTYHCDIQLAPGMINKFIRATMDFSNKRCLKKSRFIAVQTEDYASHSRVAYAYENKFVETATPIKEYERRNTNYLTQNQKTIGFCGRLVEEKGIDVLLKAFYQLKKSRTDLILKIGGDYQNIAGGSIYHKLKAYIDNKNLRDVEFLGKIPEEDMEEFYSSLDVFVLPSINSLEAFGMVQIEAMLCGTPVVASDLYGVRTIVERTGMGVVVKRGDEHSLAAGISKILEHPEEYIKPREEILSKYGTRQCIEKYSEVMDIICG